MTPLTDLRGEYNMTIAQAGDLISDTYIPHLSADLYNFFLPHLYNPNDEICLRAQRVPNGRYSTEWHIARAWSTMAFITFDGNTAIMLHMLIFTR